MYISFLLFCKHTEIFIGPQLYLELQPGIHYVRNTWLMTVPGKLEIIKTALLNNLRPEILDSCSAVIILLFVVDYLTLVINEVRAQLRIPEEVS